MALNNLYCFMPQQATRKHEANQREIKSSYIPLFEWTVDDCSQCLSKQTYFQFTKLRERS